MTTSKTAPSNRETPITISTGEGPINIPTMWVECTACHRDDDFIGMWIECPIIRELASVPDIHCHTNQQMGPDHTTLWCYDSEYTPTDQTEFSLDEAARIGDLYREMVAYCESNVMTTSRDVDITDEWFAYLTLAQDYPTLHDAPTITEFRDAYFGHFPTFTQFADEYARESGLITGWPSRSMMYFNWNQWEDDLRIQFDEKAAPSEVDGGVYIFTPVPYGH